MNRDAKDVNEDEYEAQLRRKPNKILRYFPLISRLQKLFMSSKTAEFRTWHNDQRTDDGLSRHPTDSLAWKSFDNKFPSFASDPRSVKIGLASDEFNPFKIMSTSYSTWPVVLVPYNLPPWLCMKQSSLILSMIIPGEKGLGYDIDINLEPLIDELKQLWAGVETYDERLKEKKAEYEAVASIDSSVNHEDIDNRIITEVLGPKRKYEEFQQQLIADAAEREAVAAARAAEAAAMAAEQSKKYDELQL
ncbi:hypothetical protein J1N35_021337 [Gossypium stocksii]|uniref:Uncharacterized protein n=1 Tax=Gossypium stocksii TaxID=47602 RepID=A0A9D4A035_9ROSI|nr:hypothetical protein J1N35_021337 [Gossypium stocksii]